MLLKVEKYTAVTKNMFVSSLKPIFIGSFLLNHLIFLVHLSFLVKERSNQCRQLKYVLTDCISDTGFFIRCGNKIGTGFNVIRTICHRNA